MDRSFAWKKPVKDDLLERGEVGGTGRLEKKRRLSHEKSCTRENAASNRQGQQKKAHGHQPVGLRSV
jgi:hypothetical protein